MTPGESQWFAKCKQWLTRHAIAIVGSAHYRVLIDKASLTNRPTSAAAAVFTLKQSSPPSHASGPRSKLAYLIHVKVVPLWSPKPEPFSRWRSSVVRAARSMLCDIFALKSRGPRRRVFESRERGRVSTVGSTPTTTVRFLAFVLLLSCLEGLLGNFPSFQSG